MANDKELTLEEIEVASTFDVLLLSSCTTKEQEEQMLRIIQSRKRQKRKNYVAIRYKRHIV